MSKKKERLEILVLWNIRRKKTLHFTEELYFMYNSDRSILFVYSLTSTTEIIFRSSELRHSELDGKRQKERKKKECFSGSCLKTSFQFFPVIAVVVNNNNVITSALRKIFQGTIVFKSPVKSQCAEMERQLREGFCS